MKLKLKIILKNAASQLQESGNISPRLDAEVIMAFLLQKDRSYLFMYPEKEILPSVYEAYLSLIEARKNGVPVPYIVNNQEFMNLDFFVNESVLIPRPDTEILVESVIKTLRGKKTNTRILDLGCGSGAISISLAFYIPFTEISGVDICDKAIRVSQKNALRHGVSARVSFHLGDLFEPVKEKKYHVIVSNPPYIPSKDINTLQIEVSKYEPRNALDGGSDGLVFYRRIISDAPKYIEDGGNLFLEIGHDQASAICALLTKREAYSDVEVIKDLAGRDRVVKARVRGAEG